MSNPLRRLLDHVLEDSSGKGTLYLGVAAHLALGGVAVHGWIGGWGNGTMLAAAAVVIPLNIGLLHVMWRVDQLRSELDGGEAR